MAYEYLEDIGIADIAFRAEGERLEDVFISAAEATMNVMIEDLNAIERRQTIDFHLENDQLDMLLFDFLQEFIYHKDASQMLFRIQELRIEQREGNFQLQASAAGEKLDPGRHQQRVDVKAVTLHRFSLHQTARGWQATVLLDI